MRVLIYIYMCVCMDVCMNGCDEFMCIHNVIYPYKGEKKWVNVVIINIIIIIIIIIIYLLIYYHALLLGFLVHCSVFIDHFLSNLIAHDNFHEIIRIHLGYVRA